MTEWERTKKILVVASAIGVGLVIFETLREMSVAEAGRPELYADAYAHAATALIEKYPRRLNWEKVGEYTPGHVVGQDGATFAVAVVYRGWDPDGRPMAKTAEPTVMRYTDGLWTVVSLASIPLFEEPKL